MDVLDSGNPGKMTGGNINHLVLRSQILHIVNIHPRPIYCGMSFFFPDLESHRECTAI